MQYLCSNLCNNYRVFSYVNATLHVKARMPRVTRVRPIPISTLAPDKNPELVLEPELEPDEEAEVVARSDVDDCAVVEGKTSVFTTAEDEVSLPLVDDASFGCCSCGFSPCRMGRSHYRGGSGSKICHRT